jgi:outer membrane protein OmpA-like peptidoglycan-associated protein
VGREAVTRNMDVSGLRGFLSGLKNQAAGAMPGPLANVFGGAADATRLQPPAVAPLPARSGSGTWLLAGLIALGALALLMWRRNAHQETARMNASRAQQAALPAERPRMLSADSITALTQTLQGGGTLPQRFVLRDLSFRTDSAEIQPGSGAVLDQVATALSAHPTARIRVEGHTDTTGPADLNRKLSQERAESTRAYLMSKGVAGDRITSAGFGSDSPLSTNSTADGRSENRRTEIVVLSR